MGLSVSLTINIVIVSVFAHGLYQKTNADVVSEKLLSSRFIFSMFCSILKYKRKRNFPGNLKFKL